MAAGDWIEDAQGVWHDYGAASRMPAPEKNFTSFHSTDCSYINLHRPGHTLPDPDVNDSCPIDFTGYVQRLAPAGRDRLKAVAS